MNITETSRKDEVMTSDCELVDQQEEVIRDLAGKKNTLTFLLTFLFITHILDCLDQIVSTLGELIVSRIFNNGD